MTRKSNTNCLNCKKPIYRTPKQIKEQSQRYCKDCIDVCNQKIGFIAAEKRYITYIINWKQGKHSGMRGNSGISHHIRKYLFKKYNSKCSKCGWSKVNKYSDKIPLEVEHKNGNFRDNRECNLDLLCPNCHSLTKTYKSLNKGNGRPR